MDTAHDSAHEIAAKVEVLNDLEGEVLVLMDAHERKRDLWFPSDLLGPASDKCPDEFLQNLREQAAGIPDHVRAALALNMLTEEGLPHFHRLLAVYLGDDSH
ncbi:MAG TPA: acyl-ACP desaturase [Gemmatimonadales bacterium]|jgi:acyl-[acyl-carrier-protein] desaturase